MLDLKLMEKTEKGMRAVYEVRHNTSEFKTTLTQDLHLTVCPATGAVTGELIIKELAAASLDEAFERLALWCERLAAALREPRKVTASIPVFEKDQDAILKNSQGARSPGMTWSRLEAMACALKIPAAVAKEAAAELRDGYFISYPWTETPFLPATAKEDVPEVLKTIEAVLPGMTAGIAVDTQSGFFKEVFPYAHHAIAPASMTAAGECNFAELTPAAKDLYRLIAESYLRCISPPSLETDEEDDET